MAKRATAAKIPSADKDAPAARAWAADAVERWPLAKIIPYPKNSRLHSNEQVAQIAASMKRFGVTSPVLVDEAGVLIYGHGRRRAAELLGYAELPVVVAKGWSEDEKRAYRITDNQLTLLGEWDLPTLTAELQDLKAADFELPILGFPKLKLVEFLAGAPQEPSPGPGESEMVDFRFGDYKARVGRDIYAAFSAVVEDAKAEGQSSLDEVLRAWVFP